MLANFDGDITAVNIPKIEILKDKLEIFKCYVFIAI